MRTSPSRRWSSSHPCGRAIRRSDRRGLRLGGRSLCRVGECRRGEGTECETGDGGCRFEASEAVEEYRESCQGGTDDGDVARVVAVADGQSDVIERRQRVAVFGPQAETNRSPAVIRRNGCRYLGRSPGPGARLRARGRDQHRGRRSRRPKACTRAHRGCGWLRRRRAARSRRPAPPHRPRRPSARRPGMPS